MTTRLTNTPEVTEVAGGFMLNSVSMSPTAAPVVSRDAALCAARPWLEALARRLVWAPKRRAMWCRVRWSWETLRDVGPEGWEKLQAEVRIIRNSEGAETVDVQE